jgi:hypothetical protein
MDTPILFRTENHFETFAPNELISGLSMKGRFVGVCERSRRGEKIQSGLHIAEEGPQVRPNEIVGQLPMQCTMKTDMHTQAPQALDLAVPQKKTAIER